MYRLLIADDEEIIRNALLTLIDWENLGFEIVGVFEDGREVVDFLAEGEVDAVLTDIKMYTVSGLEIAKYCKVHRPHVKVCIISGYQDFDFLKEALHQGVCDYLLKPIDAAALRNLFSRIAAELQRQNTMPFDYFASAAHVGIQSAIDRLIKGLFVKDAPLLRQHHRELFTEMRHAEDEVVFFTITRLFEQLFEHAGRRGYVFPPDLTFSQVMDGLRQSPHDRLQEQTLSFMQRMAGVFRSYDANSTHALSLQLKEYIHTHLADDLSLDVLSGRFSFNQSYLSRKFRADTGETLVAYITNRRMDRAMTLLRETENTLESISEQVGYHDIKYFSRCFKMYAGCTAHEFRRRWAMRGTRD